MRSERRRRNANTSKTRGLTLVEVLVAIAILGVALSTLMSAMLVNTNINRRVDRRAEAIRISEDVLEGYRQASNYGELRTPVTQTVTRRNQAYTVRTTFCPSDTPSALPCSGSAVFIRVEVNHGTTNLHKAETYYTSFGAE